MKNAKNNNLYCNLFSTIFNNIFWAGGPCPPLESPMGYISKANSVALKQVDLDAQIL